MCYSWDQREMGLFALGVDRTCETLERGKVKEHNAQLTSVSELVAQSQRMAQCCPLCTVKYLFSFL